VALNDIVTGNDLGIEFDIGTIQAGKIRLKIGSNLAIAPDGTISAIISGNVTKETLYEYRDIWAEESGGTNANNTEWSFGNGATGTIGLPIGEGWEVVEMYFQADVYAATATIQVDLLDMSDGLTGVANTVSSIRLSNSTDGGGQTNNAFKIELYATPISVGNTATGLLGFITRGETGNISDARVGARLRRKIGEYVSDITI